MKPKRKKTSFRILCTAPAGGKPKDDPAPRVEGEAYTGGKMRMWFGAIVVDLAGMKRPAEVPLLVDHANRTASRIGMVSTSVADGILQCKGVIVSTSDVAKDVVEQADAGAEWQMSIGADILAMEYIEDGVSRVVNGRAFNGPLDIITESELKEISVVPVGADTDTRMRLAAAWTQSGGRLMKAFEIWAKGRGLDIAAMTEQELAAARAEYEEERAAEEELAAARHAQESKDKAARKVARREARAKVLAGMDAGSRTEEAVGEEHPITAAGVARAIERGQRLERERHAAITDICGKDFPELAREGIRSGWTEDQTRQKVLAAYRSGEGGRRAQRVPLGRSENALTPEVLECALARRTMLRNLDKHYKPEVIEASEKAFRSGIGLNQLFLECALQNGYTGRARRVEADSEMPIIVRAAWGNGGMADMGSYIQADMAPSTISIAGILSNYLHKKLMDGFNYAEPSWKAICEIVPVSDFKTHHFYRLTSDMRAEKVAVGGALTHGKLSQESYTNAAETYGKIFSIDRHHIVNDDLNAIAKVPEGMGNGMAVTLIESFWAELFSTAAYVDPVTGSTSVPFFHASRGNLFTGTGSAFGLAGMKQAVPAFKMMKNSAGYYIGFDPMYILCSPAQEADVDQFLHSTTVMPTAAFSSGEKQIGVINPYANMFQRVSSRYVQDSKYGDTATGWGLIGNPAQWAPMQVCFLNGRDVPILEQVQLQGDHLGVLVRAYMDWGVTRLDPRAIIWNTGVSEEA